MDVSRDSRDNGASSGLATLMSFCTWRISHTSGLIKLGVILMTHEG